MSEAGALRAAHYQTHFLPQGLKRRAFDPWLAALRTDGRNPQDHRVGIIRSILVTDDIDTDWPVVRAAERYRMALYRRFFEESGEGFGASGEPIPQTWIVGDVDHCVSELQAFIATFGITDIVTMALPPGLRSDQMAPSLERLFTQVVPRLKTVVSEQHRAAETSV
jgi:alkanesulfonate monooxygenase SsuD/methylene tetrahydromethanopterin reductase-like flavin-dependent oxidoreductase (luciferase family)